MSRSHRQELYEAVLAAATSEPLSPALEERFARAFGLTNASPEQRRLERRLSQLAIVADVSALQSEVARQARVFWGSRRRGLAG